jgi:fatty-acyl-CoA synthase
MLFPLKPVTPDPQKVAIQICETGEQLTFAQLDHGANRVARVLRSLGIQRGDHVALLLPNGLDFLKTCFGLDRAGVYYTTINTRLTLDEIVHILQDCDARLFLMDSRLDVVQDGLQTRLSNQVLKFCVGEPLAGFGDWKGALSDASDAPIEDASQGLDMLYSSGTTGRPKGVKWPLVHRPAGERTMLVDLLQPLFSYDEHTRYLSPAPLYHAAPLRHCMSVVKLGGTIYVMQHFDAEQSLAWIDRFKITHAQWVPTMFVRLLKLPEEKRLQFDLSSLNMALHAAAPCPVEVKHRMLAWWGNIIHEYYAGTENNGFCAITPDEWLSHPGSVGRARQGRLHICDEQGNELPAGATGLVYFSDGPEFSYHKDPEKTAQSRNTLGWSTLGDIGFLDPEGYLYLVDRKAFMIISGGINIYPQEVENVLIDHPQVLDVAVVGVPDEDLGESVKAVVQLVDPLEANAALSEELIAFCRQRLASFKCPRSIDFDAALPRHPTGKLYKQLVRDRYR